VDVSLSGLSVQAPLALSQGDPVWVEFHEPLRVEIKALAWNIRRLRPPARRRHPRARAPPRTSRSS